MSHSAIKSRAKGKKAWRDKRIAERRSKGKCALCGDPSESFRCDPCRKKNNDNIKAYRRRLKMEVFEAYGGARCACKNCPEHTNPHLSFLTLNHIGGGGNKHRLNLGGVKSRTGLGGYNNSVSVFLWVKRNGFPPGFNVLCWNCQWGHHLNNQKCPHEEEKAA